MRIENIREWTYGGSGRLRGSLPGLETFEDEQEVVVPLCHPRVVAGHRGADKSLEEEGACCWEAVVAVAAVEEAGRERRRASPHHQDIPLDHRHDPGSEHCAGEDRQRALERTLALVKRRE